MHPLLLYGPKNLLILAVIWSPLCLLAVVLHVTLGKIGWVNSTIFMIPLMMAEFYICLSIWHLAKTTPLDPQKIKELVVRHGLSALVLNSLWLLIAKVYSSFLDFLTGQQGIWETRYTQSIPLLLSIGFFFYFLSCLFHYLILTLEKAKEAEQRVVEQRLYAAEAEFRALKSTIQPHFLFNVLTALATLSLSSPQIAQKVCLQLSDFLRYSLRYGKRKEATVKEELQHIQNYLNIEQVRFGERLQMKYEVEESTLSLPLLPLFLLPLVENSIKHGIQQTLEGGTISVKIQRQDQDLLICVSNPYEESFQASHGEGLGILTLETRIGNRYGDKGKIEVQKDEENFAVWLRLPIEEKHVLIE